MTAPKILSAKRTAELLPYAELADEIATVLRQHAAGDLTVPERTVLDLPTGTLLSMPAADSRLAIVKVVTVHPGNAGSHLPTITGEVIVIDANAGRRLGVLHGGTVTVRRTAALSLLAVRTLRGHTALASGDSHGSRASTSAAMSEGTLLVLGAGAQARGHAEALAGQPGVTGVVIASRTAPRAAELVHHLGALGHPARTVAAGGHQLSQAVAEAAIVVTATTSRTPVIGGDVRPGTVVCAVGAYRSDMAELAPSVVADAASVVVDTLAGCQVEAGDLIQAVDAGRWHWGEALPLTDLLVDTSKQRQVAAQGGYKVFKSVGHALYDLAAARVAFPAGGN